MQQPSSTSVLISTPWVVEPSPTTRLLSGKAPATKASFIQVPSSSSEEHVDFSGEEYDFGDQSAPLDTRKYSHISGKDMQVDVPATALPSGEVTITEGISSMHLIITLLV